MTNCQYCEKAAQYKCTNCNVSVCKEHAKQKHRGDGHKLQRLAQRTSRSRPSSRKPTRGKKSAPTTPKGRSKSQAQTKNAIGDKQKFSKESVRQIVSSELQKLRDFREQLTTKLMQNAEIHIHHIMTRMFEMQQNIESSCRPYETEIEETINQLLENKGRKTVDIDNRILARANETSDGEILQLNASCQSHQLDLANTMTFEIQMRKLNAIIDIEAYYNNNLNRIPEKLKEFFIEVINEDHYSKDKLVINGVDLGKHATKHLVVLLPLYGRITKLKLAGLNLKAEGMRRIAVIIGKMQMLVKLELPNNNCGPVGAKALAAALRHNPLIHKLNLDDNDIGHEGCRYIASVLKNMNKIKSISLNSNRLNSESAKTLATALSTCETLEQLNLEENEFSTQDKQAVRRVLAKNCRVNI